MNTISQLQLGVNKYWAEEPSNSLSPVELIVWYAGQDLASFAEMTVDLEDLVTTFPETYFLLCDMQSYLKEIGQLPPLALAHVMLMIERVDAGLTARGDDTKPPPKPLTVV